MLSSENEDSFENLSFLSKISQQIYVWHYACIILVQQKRYFYDIFKPIFGQMPESESINANQ